MQEQHDQPQTNERPPPVSFLHDERGVAGADRGLCDRDRHGDEQRRSEDERGSPTDAEDEHPRKKGDRQVPLGSEREGPTRTAGLVERLERRGAPDPLVDASTQRGEVARDAPSVDPSQPAQLADRAVPRRPLTFQQGLGLPVADLLLPELPDRLTSVMPNHGGRCVADDPSRSAKRPDKTDAAAAGPENRAKSPNASSGPFPKALFASWDVLCDSVAEQ